MLNNVCVQGRVAKDAELRYTPSGVPVASFTIGCDRDFKPKHGDRECDWIDVVAWNGAAEFAHKYFRKGDLIIVSGRIQTRTYEDRNGNKRKAVEVVADSFNFCGGRKDGGRQEAAQGQPYAGGPGYGEGSDGFVDEGYGVEDDLPFK